MRFAGQEKGGFYPTPEFETSAIAALVGAIAQHRSDGQCYRLLDPCCGMGEALAQIKDYYVNRYRSSIETYGVELHADRAETAATLLDHVVCGDLFNMTIANDQFSMLFLNPPYDYAVDDKRTEHTFLVRATRYLAPNGVLVYIIPRYVLRSSSKFLLAWFKDLKVYYFSNQNRKLYDQVVVIGVKRPRAYAVMGANEALFEAWATKDEPPPIYSPKYSGVNMPMLPAGDIEFRTRTFDGKSSAVEAKVSGMWANKELQDLLWPQEDETVRPLMPLRRGHMAMLVAAGFLNNLVLEEGDERLMVRGRTIKEMVLVEETEEKEVYRERLKTTVMMLNLDTGTITDIQA